MSNDLRRLTEAVGLCLVDVGARGGPSKGGPLWDFAALAPAIDYVGFEPDAEECERLLRTASDSAWRSEKFVPLALSDQSEDLSINLYSKRGCTSTLTARLDIAELFARRDWYDLDGVVTVSARALDDLIAEAKVPAPAFMKIDVQGMEGRVLRGARQALATSLVGIRAEVSFFQFYESQDQFADIDRLLQSSGFALMGWLESHAWRRLAQVPFPRLAEGSFPCSRGQLSHADALYLARPEALAANSDAEIERLVRLGIVAAHYGHIDHAYAAMAGPRVREYVLDKLGTDPFTMLSAQSKALGRRMWIERVLERVKRRFPHLFATTG